jgi:hypothetical protein
MLKKYASAAKADDFSLTDIGQLLSVDRFLLDFEAGLKKLEAPVVNQFESIAKSETPEQVAAADTADTAAVADVAVAAVSETVAVATETPAEQTTAPVADGETAESVAKAASDPALTNLAKQVQTLAQQMEVLFQHVQSTQTAVAKARTEVPVPASAVGNAEEIPVAKSTALLFPRDYNDPCYRDELKKRGIED